MIRCLSSKLISALNFPWIESYFNNVEQAEDVVQHLNESVVFDVRGVLDEQSYLEAGANFIKVGFLK